MTLMGRNTNRCSLYQLWDEVQDFGQGDLQELLEWLGTGVSTVTPLFDWGCAKNSTGESHRLRMVPVRCYLAGKRDFPRPFGCDMSRPCCRGPRLLRGYPPDLSKSKIIS